MTKTNTISNNKPTTEPKSKAKQKISVKAFREHKNANNKYFDKYSDIKSQFSNSYDW